MTLFCHPQSQPRFMLIKAQESTEYLALIAQVVKELQPEASAVFGGDYQVDGNLVTLQPAQRGDEPFAAHSRCIYQEWVEPEQLFGCVRWHKDQISLQYWLGASG